MNIKFKRKGKYCKFHLDVAKNVWSLCSKLEVFISRHVVYVPMSSTTFRGILIYVIFRSRDMQECYSGSSQEILVYIPCLFSIYPLSRFPIHGCLFIFCIASLGIFYKGVSWKSRFTSTDHVYLQRNRS
jgi:hypothetical protein